MAAPMSKASALRVCRVCSFIRFVKLAKTTEHWSILQAKERRRLTTDQSSELNRDITDNQSNMPVGHDDNQSNASTDQINNRETLPMNEAVSQSLHMQVENEKITQKKKQIQTLVLPKHVGIDPIALEIIMKENEHKKFPSYKKHPGVVQIKKMIQIPPKLINAMDIILKDSKKKFIEDGLRLAGELYKRQLPETDKQVTQKANKVLEERIFPKMPQIQMQRLQELQENPDLSLEEEKEKTDIESNIFQKMTKEVRRTTYHYKPLLYDKTFAYEYLVARMIPNYSVILQCLSEIKKRNPDYVPESLLNMGSGLGSAVWATQKIWPSNIKQYFCVDNSKDMTDMAQLLLQEGHSNWKSFIPNVYFRDTLPDIKGGKFSLVVCAYTLMDYLTLQKRLHLVRELWERTEDYLVLIDVGTFAGHQVIQDARRHLINRSRKNKEDLEVFSPCPHKHRCPKFELFEKVPCNFEVKHQLPKYQIKDEVWRMERYCYAVMKRGEVTDIAKEWPRIVNEIKRPTGKKMVNCQLCSSDGTLANRLITVGKSGKPLHRISYDSTWGDLLPIQSELQNTNAVLRDSDIHEIN